MDQAGGGPLLFFDFHATPEGDKALDFASSRFGIRVVPGCIGIVLAVDQEAHVASLTFPGTRGSGAAGAKKFTFEARVGEVDIAFNGLCHIAFGDHLAIPNCSCH